MGKHWSVSKLILLVVTSFLAYTEKVDAASPSPGSLFSYEGVLTDSSGNPITTPQTLTFEVIYSTSCVTYAETQTLTPGASGEFSVLIGSGTRTDSTGNTAARIFASSGSINCEGSSPVTVSGFTTRSLRIHVGATTLTPDVTIGNIPFAINAQKLDDKASDSFVNVNSGLGVTQSNVESIFQRYTKLDAILNTFNAGGTSAGFDISGNAATATTATNVTGTVAVANGGTGATTATAARTNLGLGTLATLNPTGTADATTYLRGDGKWEPITGGGSVTSVAGRTGAVTLSSADITDFNSQVETKINSQKGQNNGLASLDSSGKIPASQLDTPTLSGNVTGTFSSTKVEGLQGRSLSDTTPLDGQAILWDNTANTWKPQYVRMQDIRNTWGGSQMIPSVTCDSGQSMVWSVITDRFTCQNISISTAQITGLGALATKSSVDLSADVTGIIDIARLPTSVKYWTAATGGISYSAGNVGIGTTTPSEKLEIAGAIKIVDGTQAAGRVLTSDSTGKTSWQPIPSNFAGSLQVTSTTHSISPSDAGKVFYYTGSSSGTFNLPLLSNVSDGYSVTINRQVPQALTISTSGSDRFPGGISIIEMRGRNLQSVTMMKIGTLWILNNQTEECTIGQECWTANSTGGMKQIYAGTYNGRQYFTTPGGCTDSSAPICGGGSDQILKQWQSTASNTAAINSIDGATNSTSITATSPAASFCENMTYAGYTDWYLPARQELQFLYQNSATIGGFTYGSAYWSSTESSSTNAWAFLFDYASIDGKPKTTLFYVRCIRKF